MAQHFLMSAAARTLSLIDLCDLSEDAAHKMLCGMRWPDTDGAPICPHCSCVVVYTYRCRRLFKCKAVFLVLAAQYESWSMPFMVLLSVPLALFGAVLALRLRDMQLDVYSEIGLVMLIGLAAKNAILIVEFAKQLRERGAGIVEAAMEAGRLRLRPILMTAFAFILGSLPLMVASGAGAGSRQSIGTTVVGGMLAGTILGLALVPVLYAVIERLREGRISSGVPSADQGRFKGAAGD